MVKLLLGRGNEEMVIRNGRYWSSKLLLIFILLITACDSQDNIVGRQGGHSDKQLKIQVEQDGFYRVTLKELRDAGLMIESLIPENLYLSQLGAAVPYLINENVLIFYGQAPDNRYTATRPYLLEFGKPGTLIGEEIMSPMDAPVVDQVPLVKHFEENDIYNPQALNVVDDDNWHWETINPQQKLPLSISVPAASDRPAAIRINLWGVTHDPRVDNDHDLDLLLNGQSLGTIRWDGSIYYDSRLDIAPGTLINGENTLILNNEAIGANKLDIMELNWLELTYMAPPVAIEDQLEFRDVTGTVTLSGFSDRPHIFDINDPNASKILTGWDYGDEEITLAVRDDMHIAAIGPDGYLSPTSIEPVRQSGWRKIDNQADLLIVTTDDLAPALTPLIEAREAQGLRVALATVSEIYDEFGFGEASPESIQSFVSHAYNKWRTPSPAYLLLVGDATSDYRGYLRTVPKNIVPSPMVPVIYGGETVSDSRIADVTGDMRPELAVGRWPVTERSDVKALVERTLAYEQSEADDISMFATDGTEARFANLAKSLWTASDFSDSQIKLIDGPQASEVTAQWNEGAWLTTYIGHGSVQLWGKDNIFNPEAVSDLEAATPPIVLQLTCLTGLFAHPELTSLSETMLRHEQGPVLVIAATSLTLSNDQEPFAHSLLQNLRDPSIERIGDAFQEAKLALDIENSGALREISDTFALFGDPTTLVVRPG